MDSLFVIKGNDQGRRYTLDDSVITIGRDSSNKIRIHDPEVSRRHAKITFKESERVLVDLDSANGIFVNGKQVRSRVLVNNDQIQSKNDEMYEQMAKQYPDSTKCAELIDEYISSKIAIRMNREEIMYLVIHINRMISRI